MGEPLFPGNNELKQVEIILEKCGSLDDEDKKYFKSFHYFKEYSPKKSFRRTLIEYIKKSKLKYFINLTVF